MEMQVSIHGRKKNKYNPNANNQLKGRTLAETYDSCTSFQLIVGFVLSMLIY